MVKEDLQNKTKDQVLNLLRNERTKQEAIKYFQMDPTFLLQNITGKEFYNLLVEIEEPSFIDKYIDYILKNKNDYYLLLQENNKNHLLDNYLNRYMLDILYKNHLTIKKGAGEYIENTILYGIKEEDILKKIHSILKIGIESVWFHFLEETTKYPNIFSYLEQNSFKIIEKVIPKDRIFLYINQMIKNGYKDIIKENENAIIASLVDIDSYILEYEKLMLPIKLLINELLEKTNTKIEDIEHKGSGAFSNTYKIGNLILKSGIKINKKMPYHPRFLSPFLRKEMIEDKYLEVYKYVKPALELSKEEVYEIYKELREDGIIWIDPRAANLGILLEDNDTKIKGETIEVKEESIGFTSKIKHKTYKKGDIVIFDVDTAVYEEDFKLEDYDLLIDLRAYNEMETRYQKEKTRSAFNHK